MYRGKLVITLTVTLVGLLSSVASATNIGKASCDNYNESEATEGAEVVFFYAYCNSMREPESFTVSGRTIQSGKSFAVTLSCVVYTGTARRERNFEDIYRVRKAGEFTRTFEFRSNPDFKTMFDRYRNVRCFGEARMVLPADNWEGVWLKAVYG